MAPVLTAFAIQRSAFLPDVWWACIRLFLRAFCDGTLPPSSFIAARTFWTSFGMVAQVSSFMGSILKLVLSRTKSTSYPSRAWRILLKCAVKTVVFPPSSNCFLGSRVNAIRASALARIADAPRPSRSSFLPTWWTRTPRIISLKPLNRCDKINANENRNRLRNWKPSY